MLLSSISLHLLLLTLIDLTYCAALNDSGIINWLPCQVNTTWPLACGSLRVPLDYTDTNSDQSVTLSLVRVNATKQPVKGSILFNPGGPGGSGRNFLAQYGRDMLISTGGQFNLISFDPRGTVGTLPFSCFSNNNDRAQQVALISQSSNASDTTLGLLWSAAGAIAEECNMTSSQSGQYIGTAFVARDMMQIVDALGEDGMLRYWGLSYGTVLGATAAAMFPDRIDKMVLDGVVNAHEWYAGTNREQVMDADAAVRAFVRDCLAAPATCPLAQSNATIDNIYDDLVELVDSVKYHPPVIGSNLTTGLVQYSRLKTLIYTGVKNGVPNAKGLALYLDAILQDDPVSYAKALSLLNTPSSAVFPAGPPESLYGIECADTTLKTDDFATFDSLIQEWYASSFFGGDQFEPTQFACGRWKIRSKEIYTGPFTGQTKTPILFISSPYDPTTPLVSAQNMSAGFMDSHVLQHNHIGHCSISQPSKCTVDATRAYFVNGTLPAVGAVCEPDFNLFSNYTVSQIYQMADGELAVQSSQFKI